MVKPKDFVTDSLLALNGDRYFIDAKGERVICFDNAHAVSLGPGPGKKLSRQYDHKHIGNKVFPYTFEDAYSLVADFWKEVDKLKF